MKNSFEQINSEILSTNQKIVEILKNLGSDNIKNHILLECCINPYYGKTFDLSDPLVYDCTRLVEKLLRRLNSNMEPTNGDHSDDICTDTGFKSDTKTSSFNINPMKDTNNTHVGNISGVSSQSCILKEGSLRVVITDPFFWKCHYFYIPLNVWSTWKLSGCRNKDGKIKNGSIPYTYNRQTGLIAKLEPHRVGGPIELANCNY
jgi:hypothetical protein